MEDNKEDGAIPFLDTTVKPEADGGLSITVYRKSTHTDQYLQWDSHHHLSAKNSVIITLIHRATAVCNKAELFQKEMDHLRKALTHCMYPKWAIDRVERRLSKLTIAGSSSANTKDTAGANTPPVKSKPRITLSYLTPRVYAKTSRRSVVSMTYRPTSRVTAPSKTSWFLPRIRTLWRTNVGSSTGTMWGPCM